MNDIIKITISGVSGFCPVDEAYSDKVTITPSSISYEYKPHTESRLETKPEERGKGYGCRLLSMVIVALKQ